jgi:flagellar motor switch protein FliN/FliY
MTDKSSAVRLIGEKGGAPDKIDESLIAGLEVKLEARLGSAVMKVAELLELKTGDCVPLDAALNSDVELRLNGVTVARGELVSVGTSFGVRIAEIVRQ